MTEAPAINADFRDIIDILTGIDGVTFDQAWAGRLPVEMGSLAVPVLGRAELIANKRAAGRPKDRSDLDLLLSGPSEGP